MKMSDGIIRLTRDFFPDGKQDVVGASYPLFAKAVLEQFEVSKKNSHYISKKSARDLSLVSTITRNRRCELMYSERSGASIIFDFGLPYLVLQVFRIGRYVRALDRKETKASGALFAQISWVLGASLRMEHLANQGRFEEAFGYLQAIKVFRDNKILSNLVDNAFLADLLDDGEREVFHHCLLHILDHELMHYSQINGEASDERVTIFFEETITAIA